NGAIGTIGFEPQIADAAFKLSSTNQFTEKPVKGKNGYYIIRFKERTYPLEQDFEKEKEGIIKVLLEKKKEITFSSWLAQVKSSSNIIKEKEYLE
ncbi:MAG: hypothetical protein KKA35_15130, partial [Proteobacteria bacterium]|nr:hypothetical protein [Pseudomonadota bacterium]